MKRAWIALPLAMLLLLAAPLPAAEPLADRLPAGTLLYLGWAGNTKALDDSLAGKLFQEPGFAKMIEMVRVAAAGASRDARPLVEGAWDLGVTAIRHPIAVALVDVEASQQGPPAISAALLIDLGADRKDFAQKLDALIERTGMKLEEGGEGDLKYRQLPSPAGPIAMGYIGDRLFLCVGKDMPKRLAAVAPATSLSADKNYVEAMKAVAGADLQAAFYLDAAGLMKRAQALLGPEQAPGAKGPGFSKVMQSLGLGDVKSVAATLCVTDGLFHSKMRLATPAPHKGLLLPFAGDPLTDADLAPLPEDTDFVAACKFSAEGLYDEVRRMIRELSPETDVAITGELANPKGVLSALAIKDLLGSLGQTWTISCADSYGGSLTGTLLTVEVNDANRFAAASARLEAILKQTAASPADGGSKPETDRSDAFVIHKTIEATIRVAKSGEVEAHYVAFSGAPIPVAPAWALYKGRLYIAAWPQVIFSAIDNQAKAPLIKNAAFAQMRARLGTPSILSYINTPRFVRQGYGLPLVLWTMASGMIPAEGPQSALPDWLPPLSVIEKYIRPEMSSVSSDKDGITFEGYGTIPGLAAAPAAPALGVAVLMPALSKARFQARKASSMANLSMIGKALAIYTASHKDQFPPDLAALIADGDAMPAILVSPLSGRQPPKYDKEKKTLVGETDYIYIPLDSAALAYLICAYERPENHNNEGTNVLYADLHVGYLPMSDFQEALKKTQEYLGKRKAN